MLSLQQAGLVTLWIPLHTLRLLFSSPLIFDRAAAIVVDLLSHDCLSVPISAVRKRLQAGRRLPRQTGAPGSCPTDPTLNRPSQAPR
jgi:hypothetical protein